MTHYDSYVICTSPRSGSTLLCKLLAATGVAGKPESYFFRPSIEDWLTRLDITPDAEATERQILDTVFRAAVRKGRDGTGLFGLRQQGHSFEFLRSRLAVLYPDEATDARRFQQAFGTTLFIHLTRPDKIGQAVSYLKAEQTGLWHIAPDGSELERLTPHREPLYDGERLRACVETMTSYDHGWKTWFAREGIEPFRVLYDDLSANPAETLRRVLGRLGLDPARADGVTPGVQKLADGTNEAWVARFRTEQGLA